MFNTTNCMNVGPGESCEIDCASPFVRVGNTSTGSCAAGNSVPSLGLSDNVNRLKLTFCSSAIVLPFPTQESDAGLARAHLRLPRTSAAAGLREGPVM